MIIRNPQNISPLEVSDLNRIAVLVDRSEAAFTEVGLNTWPAGILGPPHAHTEKEQIFVIVSGTGRVVVGESSFSVKRNDVVYVPPGVEHQTIADPKAPLAYLLFNAFLSSAKEGHATFAEHIEKVKATRSAQAAGKAASGARPSTDKSAALRSLNNVDVLQAIDGNRWVNVLNARETNRSEVWVVACSSNVTQSVVLSNAEQVLYIWSGVGTVEDGNQAHPVGPGDTVFVPSKETFATKAGEKGLCYLLLSTYTVSR